MAQLCTRAKLHIFQRRRVDPLFVWSSFVSPSLFAMFSMECASNVCSKARTGFSSHPVLITRLLLRLFFSLSVGRVWLNSNTYTHTGGRSVKCGARGAWGDNVTVSDVHFPITIDRCHSLQNHLHHCPYEPNQQNASDECIREGNCNEQ